MNEQFWGIVAAAAGIATAFATVFSLLFAIWWRNVDKQRVYWAWTAATSFWNDFDDYNRPPSAGVYGKLGNTSYSGAVSCRLVGVNCTATFQQRSVTGRNISLVPLFSAGDEYEVQILCEPHMWEKATVFISWKEPSMWRRSLKHHLTSFSIAEIADRPVLKKPFDAIGDDYEIITDQSEPVMPDFDPDIASSDQSKWKIKKLVKNHLKKSS